MSENEKKNCVYTTLLRLKNYTFSNYVYHEQCVECPHKIKTDKGTSMKLRLFLKHRFVRLCKKNRIYTFHI